MSRLRASVLAMRVMHTDEVRKTAITLDPDVAALVEKDMRERGVAFETSVNDALRQGLSAVGLSGVFATKVHDLGAYLVDIPHAHRVASDLEDDATVAKLAQGR